MYRESRRTAYEQCMRSKGLLLILPCYVYRKDEILRDIVREDIDVVETRITRVEQADVQNWLNGEERMDWPVVQEGPTLAVHCDGVNLFTKLKRVVKYHNHNAKLLHDATACYSSGDVSRGYRDLWYFFPSKAVTTAPFGKDCPDGYSMQFAGKCAKYYEMMDDGISTCPQQCAKDGAIGLTIGSKTEQTSINYIDGTTFTEKKYLSIGLKCEMVTVAGSQQMRAKYTWADGSVPTYLGNIRYQYDTFNYDVCANASFVLDSGNVYYSDFIRLDNYDNTGCLCQVPNQNNYCSDGYFFNEQFETCLKIVDSNVTWNQASKACINDGATLPSIHSEDFNNLLSSFTSMAYLTPGLTIGFKMTDDGPSWIDNTPFNYSNFDKAMPNALFGECGAMTTLYDTEKWVSVHCDEPTLNPYICQKQPNTPQQPTYCPADFYLQEGDIYSPGYPLSTSIDDQTCEYFVAAKPGHKIGITFVDFQFNGCCDRLDVYEGALTNTPLYSFDGRYNIPHAGQEYVSDQDDVFRMVLRTQSGYARGFHITFRSVD